MALGYMSGSECLTESLHSRCSPFLHPTQSPHSQKAEYSVMMCASPSRENQYSEIEAITSGSPEYDVSTQLERSWHQYHGSVHDLRSPQYTVPASAPRHHSADILTTTALTGHQPRIIVNARHQAVAPPKPRRLHVTPDIYAMPNSSGDKRHNLIDRCHAWSPLASDGRQLPKMRYYHSNEQLDVTDGDCEQLDTISNSSAPPKIAPHSGKLNKLTPDHIIKPVAFKPIITPVNRFSPCRPTKQQHLTSDLNRSQDDGYQSQDGNHANHRNTAQTWQCTALSQTNGQASQVMTCPTTNHVSAGTSCTSHALFDAGYPSPSTNRASLHGNHAYPQSGSLDRATHPCHTNSASFDRATRPLPGLSHAGMDVSQTSLSNAGATSNNTNPGSLGVAQVTIYVPQPRAPHPSHTDSGSSQSYLNTSHTSHTSSHVSHGCSSDESHASSQLTAASCHASPASCQASPGPCHTSPASLYGAGMEDMEDMLRHKETELKRLRETMDRNERALLQVYEEKRQNWEAELRDRCQDWQQKLDAAYHKSFRTEQALLIQLFKLQEERRALRKDNEQLQHSTKNLEERCTDLEQQLQQTKAHVDELNWALQQRSGEISLLKSHLKEEKEQVSSRNTELVSLRSQIKELREERDQLREDLQQISQELNQSREQFEKSKKDLVSELDEVQKEMERLKEEKTKERISAEQTRQQLDDAQTTQHKQQMAALVDELTQTRSRLVKVEEEFGRERSQWLTEKDKVIRYQKHLQLNYIQALRKNKLLEDDVEQLTLELEQHNVKLMARGASPEAPAGRPGLTLMARGASPEEPAGREGLTLTAHEEGEESIC